MVSCRDGAGPRERRVVGAVAGALTPPRGRRARRPRDARAGLGRAAHGDRRRARRARRGAGARSAATRATTCAPSSARWASPPTASSARRRAARCGTSRPRTGWRSTASSARSPRARSGWPARRPRPQRAAARRTPRPRWPSSARSASRADGVYGPITRQAVRDFQRNARAGGRRRRRPGDARRARALRQHPARVGAGSGGGVARSSAVGAAQSKLGAAYALGGEGPALGLLRPHAVGDGPGRRHDPAHELRPVRRRHARRRARTSRPATSCSSTPTARAPRTSASPRATHRDLGDHPRRARARDRRRLLGHALRRRAAHLAGANFRCAILYASDGRARHAVSRTRSSSAGCASPATTTGFAVIDADRDGDDIVLIGPLAHLEEREHVQDHAASGRTTSASGRRSRSRWPSPSRRRATRR